MSSTQYNDIVKASLLFNPPPLERRTSRCVHVMILLNTTQKRSSFTHTFSILNKSWSAASIWISIASSLNWREGCGSGVKGELPWPDLGVGKCWWRGKLERQRELEWHTVIALSWWLGVIINWWTSHKVKPTHSTTVFFFLRGCRNHGHNEWTWLKRNLTLLCSC